ncbi:MAG: lysophospholipid acyltransferase family protein [Rubrivivax sp.]
MSWLAHWLSLRSLRFLHALGALLGWVVWMLSPVYRRRLQDNACLAGVSARDRRAAVAEAGRMTLELPRLWLRPRQAPVPDPVRWEGAEFIEQALGRPGGLLILTPHLGSFEVAAHAYAQRFGPRQPMTVLYRPARKAWLRQMEETARARPGLASAPASLGGVRQLMRALREGGTVALLPDQVPPQGQGVWAPFFGQPAYTMTLAARLARQTGATVLLSWCERLPPGRGHVVHMTPWVQRWPDPQGLDDEAWTLQAATAINQAMEELILRRPSQYLWGYHRYKQPRATP